MKPITLVKAGLKDLLSLQEISRSTFRETFSEGNTADNLNLYLDEAFSLERLTEELNHPQSDFYLACMDEKVVGYLKLNFGKAQTELQDEHCMEIERIYVLCEFHGKPIGNILLNKALEIGQAQKLAFCWLGVWEKNPRAIRFYEKNGFEVFDHHIFNVGDDAQTDLLMRRPLSS